MSPTNASLEGRAQALRQATRTHSFQRSQQPDEATFPIVLRGYDRAAVDDYLEQVGRLLSELKASRTPHAAVQQALDRVGEETSAILQQAHRTADEVTTGAHSRARQRLETAEREAHALRVDAERQLRALASDTDALWRERTSMVEDMRKLAESLLEVADTAAERIPRSPADAIREAAATARREVPVAETDAFDGGEPVADEDADPGVVDEVPFAAGEDEDAGAPHAWRPLTGTDPEPEPAGDVDRSTEQFDALAHEDEDPLGGSLRGADFRH